MSKLYKKLLHVGPGGVKCACCFPAPGSTERLRMFRAAKRRDRKMAMAEAMAEIPPVR